MLMKRRPTTLRRDGVERKTPRDLNFPRLRKEAALFSDIGIILRESRAFLRKEQGLPRPERRL